DGNGWGVYAQRYDANGNPLGAEFQVNTTTDSDQTSPAVASDSQGNFIIAWQAKNQDGSGWGIIGRRYDAAGNPLGGEFQINTSTDSDQLSPTVAMNGSGAFVVSWASNNQDGGGWGVYAQRYDAAGNAVGGEFRVNTTTAGDQLDSSATMDANGNFLIAWSSNIQDGQGWGVYAKQYTASGAQLGNEFLVNSTTAGNQQYAT